MQAEREKEREKNTVNYDYSRLKSHQFMWQKCLHLFSNNCPQWQQKLSLTYLLISSRSFGNQVLQNILILMLVMERHGCDFLSILVMHQVQQIIKILLSKSPKIVQQRNDAVKEEEL